MSNINFANPLLLLVLIPLLAIVIVSYVITVNKENRSFKNVFSFVTHIIICILIALAMAKTTFEKVITETNIYVLADVSYSSNKNLDLIDEYIESLKDNVPENSKIGVIAFGKDYQELVKPGEDLVSVKNAKVDVSETNIVGALEYASTLFSDDVIKRIVIISDGEETNDSDISSTVELLATDSIYVDAIYIDNNITDDIKEVQINNVDYVESTYLNNEEKVIVNIRSNVATRTVVSLYCDGVLYNEKALVVNNGYTNITFDLKTSEAGTHKYEVKIEPTDDDSNYNNTIYFNQSVCEKMKVLFLSDSIEDKKAAELLYEGIADVTYYVNKYDAPCTIEDLCIYDEFVLSNVDIRNYNNYTQLVNSLDTLVSEFGKSLITIGNTYIQNNEEDETLTKLSDMLPVKFGNDEGDRKMVTLLLDISRSMEQIDRLNIAKKAACTILDNLDDDTYVMIIGFFGNVGTVSLPTLASEREVLKEKINKLDAAQGTFMGAALGYTYKAVSALPYEKKEVILISDGLPYREQEVASKVAVQSMANDNIVLSTIHTISTEGGALLKELATIGRGYYYYVDDLKDVESLVLDKVLNSLKETILEGSESTVRIGLLKNDLVDGISELPNILGLYNNKKKTSSDVVLETTYTDITGTSYNIPLYSTWNYGNGTVASFASSISGEWIKYWNDNEDATKVLKNMIIVNQPDERNETAFIVELDTKGTITDLIVKAPSLNKNTVLKATITYPNGTSDEKVLLSFVDSGVRKFMSEINTSMIGEYKITLSYEIQDFVKENVGEYTFNISYLPEYDSFTIYEASSLYYMVSSNGQVSEDGKLVLENTNSNVQKYIFNFIPTCMLLSVILFVVDVIIRKLRWQDILSLFKKYKKEELTRKE